MPASRHSGPSGPFGVVVMIGSLGGLESTSTVLAGLPENFAVPIVVLQHSRVRDQPEVLHRLLQRRSRLPVRMGETGIRLDRPGVTVIPRGQSANVQRDYQLSMLPADALGGGDELMASLARSAGSAVIGVVLTGMLRDGAEGVRAIKRHGGRVLVEDPSTARASGMPSAAIATGCIDFVLEADRIPAALVALTMAPGAADLLAVATPAWATMHR